MKLLQTLMSLITGLFLSISGQRIYIEGTVGQPNEIIPNQITDNPIDTSIAHLVFEGLTQIKSDGTVAPGLAKDWELSDDKKTYTFHLDPEARFHSGQPVLADDVIYTASQSEYLRGLDIEKEDNHTITINLETPFAPLLHILSTGIIPKHRENNHNPLTPVGSGPYKISKVEKGTQKIESITLRKFEPNQVGPEKIVFKFFQTEEGLRTAAELGELDGFSFIEESLGCYQPEEAILEGRYYALLFNLQGSDLLKDVNLRRTLAALVNRKKIIEEVTNGKGRPAYGPLQNTWAKGDIEKPEYDPNTEKTFEGTINITFPENEKNQQTIQIIKEDWEKVGLTVNSEPVDSQILINEVLPQRNFDVVFIGQEVGRDPDQYNLWHSTQAKDGNNLTGFENMRADKALEMGRTEHDVEQRKEHYQNFQTVFMEEMPAIFVYYPQYTYHIKPTQGDLNLEGIFDPTERWERILEMYCNKN